jgi:alkylated DNA repair dioxygenase AlkB
LLEKIGKCDQRRSKMRRMILNQRRSDGLEGNEVSVTMAARQFALFEDEMSKTAAPDRAGRNPLPEGLIYSPEFLSFEEERDLADQVARLDLVPFEFHGFRGNRRVISFGWRYKFDGSGLGRADPIPAFLLPVRERAARFAGLEPEALEHVLLTEYRPGAGIGWHRDRSAFGETIGISLLAACRLRFRRRAGQGWQRVALLAEPRSAYLLRGASRSLWEHSIPAVDRLRFSITFRSLAVAGSENQAASASD